MRFHALTSAGLLLIAAFDSGAAARNSSVEDRLPAPAPTAQAPDTHAELVRAADRALQGNRLIEARALLDMLPQQGNDDVDDHIRLLRAELLVATGRPLEARQLLATLAGPEGRTCRAIAARALADIQTSQLDEAEVHLRAHEVICTSEPVFWRARGQVYLGLGRPPAAVDAYRHALALQHDSDAVRNDLAVALIATDGAAEAAGLLGGLLREQPRRQDIAINLDFAHAMMGRIPVRRPWERDAFWSQRLQAAAMGARRAGRTGLAEALFSQALIERPRHDAGLWQQYSDVSGQQ